VLLEEEEEEEGGGGVAWGSFRRNSGGEGRTGLRDAGLFFKTIGILFRAAEEIDNVGSCGFFL
jgi:hypothetical protein